MADLAVQGALPERVMINTHPHRWHDRPLPWMKELVWQSAKNVVKKVLAKRGVRAKIDSRQAAKPPSERGAKL